jgi:hypothetical protein
MSYKILFFGEDEELRISEEQFKNIRSYLRKNPAANFIQVNDDLLNVKSIKRLYSTHKEQLPALPDPGAVGISADFLEKHKQEIAKKFSSND